MQQIARRARRLVDQFVFEQAGGFAVERGHEIRESLLAGKLLDRGTQIDDRIKAVKPAFARLVLVRLATTGVSPIDQIAESEDPVRFFRDARQFIQRNEVARDDTTIALKLLNQILRDHRNPLSPSPRLRRTSDGFHASAITKT